MSAELRTALTPWVPNRTAQFVIVVVAYTLLNLVIAASTLSLWRRESMISIWRANLSVAWVGAFIYFGVTSIVMAEVLDGSARGYLLTSAVAVLGLALTDTLAGRRQRAILESQLSDADRHLAYTRATESVVHELRNYVAIILGELHELDVRRKSGAIGLITGSIRTAAEGAAEALRRLSAGASPRVRLASEPIYLLDVGAQAVSLARPTRRNKRVHLVTRGHPHQVLVDGDPLLLREVITNLLLNAIDAAPEGGSVTLSSGVRPNGWPFLSVADNGPGFPEASRDRLFEPHFTTKPNGTGMGLFTSYGIVREHQGQLLYEGGKRGAVFTVLIPPAGS
jgi:signal transduction histidine kinase